MMERIHLPTADGPRAYSLFAPSSPHPLPLVLFLHGAGGSAEWADEETGWSRLAASERFALALPEGLPPDPAKPPKFLTNPLRWNDGSPGPTGLPSTADDVAFLARVIEDVSQRIRVDPARIYTTGFSNGAGMTFRLAGGLAGKLAAIAPVAGLFWCRETMPARPVPTLYMIGDADPLVPWRGGRVRSPWLHRLVSKPSVPESLETWAAANGCVAVPLVGSSSRGVRVEVYPGPVECRVQVIAGLGHHWPGGLGRLTPKLAGPPSNALDATAEIWRFFKNSSNDKSEGLGSSNSELTESI